MTRPLTLGLHTFGDVTAAADGRPDHPALVIRDIVEQGVLADEVGISFLGLGEHHRDDFAVTAPEVILGAIAARTSRIRLGTAVTVLSSDDPIRVFQRFATLDALSRGRAEVILGRGSFTESFPLFGFSLSDYELLFAEKLDLFSHLLAEEPIFWAGTIRPPIDGLRVHPATEGGHLTTWIGVGGSGASVVRAARYGLPLMLAIIGGDAARFGPHVDLYRRSLLEAGHEEMPVGVHSPGHVADTDGLAREQFWPHYAEMFGRIGRERGWNPPTRAQFDQETGPHGALYVGSPETVARKIAATARALDLTRFDMKYATGPMHHSDLMRGIELYGSKVTPLVHEMLA
ncbi:unannotated protein [freshwater metagenome]|uniref:Unannotated protein n=1 Tax=freshwater metagenome TaxID=449393 RepID=A0A6J7S0X8_9ZZZZ|nr:LLM class flavin-dependent oxidoreductase [Actinomycetota bacterium]MSW36661.1 LLM class flavin-dependent oxidoreductase [Actinomycetota bacterium]